MSGTTTRRALRYPFLSDTADVPRDVQNLANDNDVDVFLGSGLVASRPTSTGGSPGIKGRIYHAEDAGVSAAVPYWDYGTGWRKIPLYETSDILSTPSAVVSAGGFAPPSLTTTQRDALTSTYRPALLIIYNSTNSRFEYNAGSAGTPDWQPISPAQSQINQQSGAYTFVLSDSGKVVEYTGASANNFTVPNSSTVAYPTGTWIDLLQSNTGALSIVAAGGVNVRVNPTASYKMGGQYAMASLFYRGSNEWILTGNVIP